MVQKKTKEGRKKEGKTKFRAFSNTAPNPPKDLPSPVGLTFNVMVSGSFLIPSRHIELVLKPKSRVSLYPPGSFPLTAINSKPRLLIPLTHFYLPVIDATSKLGKRKLNLRILSRGIQDL